MKRLEHYTKVFADGTKMIFQYKQLVYDHDTVDYVQVIARCDEKGCEYFENDVVYLGVDGTSKGSFIRPATQTEIDLLNNPYLDI